MKTLTAILTLCGTLCGVSSAYAGSLSDIVPNLFGEGGILLAVTPPEAVFQHQPHFLASSEAQLTVINDSLRGQLSNIPLPSPASGFTFRFDPALGALARSTDSFGPIYSQRADTPGSGKLTFGFSYTRFTFDTLDGKNLNNGELQVTFLHAPTCTPPCDFESDTIAAKLKIGITSDVMVLTATYGLLENLDLSIALPIIHTEMNVTGEATINHMTPAGVTDHKFTNGSDSLTVHDSGDSTGVGDIVLRGKYNFLRTGPVLLAAGLDLRLPSGSVDNLRGLGTPVVSPVFIASMRPVMGFSPHGSVGFHFSGDTSKIDHELYWNVGFEWSIVRPVTFVFDILGRYVINNSRIEAGQEPGGKAISGSLIADASLGLKVNVWRNVLGVVNVLLPLNSGTGLRDKATPMIGLEATF